MKYHDTFAKLGQLTILLDRIYVVRIDAIASIPGHGIYAAMQSGLAYLYDFIPLI